MAVAGKTKIGRRRNGVGTAEKTPLKEIPIETKMYTGDAVDTLFSEFVVGSDRIAIEDEEIPGDFYTFSVRRGRLILKKIRSAENQEGS